MTRSMMKRGVYPTATARINSTWQTGSGLTPDINSVCTPELAIEIADAVEEGLDIRMALNLAGIPEPVFRDWVKRAGRKEDPYCWAVSLIKKAGASYIYNTVLELNGATGGEYRKSLDILKLRYKAVWGDGASVMTDADDDISGEFL